MRDGSPGGSYRVIRTVTPVRIGIHIGDVVDKDGDLFGTAVNIAARLEGIAQPGGSWCRRQFGMRSPESSLPLSLTSGCSPSRTSRSHSEPTHFSKNWLGSRVTRRGSPPLPSKPSIAVLPFENLSGDRDQEYFADGMVEEIITALSRMRRLFVIARNSSFAYKGRAVDVKQIGRELGVRTFSRAASARREPECGLPDSSLIPQRERILWADRFDGTLEDIFDLQDQVTASVVGAIAPKLEQAEIERTKRKPTENLDAYDYYLRGWRDFISGPRRASTRHCQLLSCDRTRPELRGGLWYGCAVLRRSARRVGG